MREGRLLGSLARRWPDLWGRVADVQRDIVARNQRMAQQFDKSANWSSRENAAIPTTFGSAPPPAPGVEWKPPSTRSSTTCWPTTSTRTIRAVAQGDLLQTMRLDVDGRPLAGSSTRSATIVNTMIKQLYIFISSNSIGAREVGTDGKLGGQAQVSEVTGVWKTAPSINPWPTTLLQVRSIADVTITVASGDLSKKITVDVRGEIPAAKEAINTMVDQLRSFAAEVTASRARSAPKEAMPLGGPSFPASPAPGRT